MISLDRASRFGRQLALRDRSAVLAMTAVLLVPAAVSVASEMDLYRAGQSLPGALRGAYVLLNGQPAPDFVGNIFGGGDVLATITYDPGRSPSQPRVALSYGVRLTHRHPGASPEERTHEIAISTTWYASREAAAAEMASGSSVTYGSFGDRSTTRAKQQGNVLPGAGGFSVRAQRGTLVVSWSAGFVACARDHERGGWMNAVGDGGATPPQDVFGLELLPAILARAPDIDVAAVVAARVPGSASARQPSDGRPTSASTRSGPGIDRRGPSAGARGKPTAADERGRRTAPGREAGRETNRSSSRATDGDTGGSEPQAGGSTAVTPAATLAAGAATALITSLGALWMLGATGLRPSDLLGALPPALESPTPLEDPPVASAESADAPLPSPPSESASASPRDGEIHAVTGEVWSDADGGWVGENLYRQEQAWQSEIARAQAVSGEESRRASDELAAAWRRSRAALDAAAERAAELGRQAEGLAALQPIRVQEYQPGWADRIGTGLEWMQWGADQSIGILEKLTGPAGESVATSYSLVKGAASGASQGVAEWLRSEDEGPSLAWAVAKGGGIGAAGVVKDMAIDAAVGKISGALQPGLGLDQIELPEIDLADQSAGSVAQRLLDRDDPLGGGILKTLGVSHATGYLDAEIKAPIEAGAQAVTGEEE
jgi:hypothetical protein